MNLGEFVSGFGIGIQRADAGEPQAVSRTGRVYQPGIGPHSESETITLALANGLHPLLKSTRREVPYPSAPRNACDVVIEDGSGLLAIEVKMLRMMGDNGKPNDNMLMHILSPYPQHRSALSDCSKLSESGFDGKKAIAIFGYEYTDFPMGPAIEAFEHLASERVTLLSRFESRFEGLIHPVHRQGAVFAWEVSAR